MAAPKIDPPTTIAPDPVKVAAPSEAKLAEWTPDARIESAPQYLDEYAPEQAMRMMRAHIALADEVRRNGGGRWEMPPTHKQIQPNGPGRTHRLTRLGTMSDVRRREAILRQRFILEQMGWKLAPPGTRNSLYLTDGDQGVYMCIAEPVALIHDSYEKKTKEEIRRRRFSRSLNALPSDIQDAGLQGMSFDRVDVTQGKSSLEDFRRMK